MQPSTVWYDRPSVTWCHRVHSKLNHIPLIEPDVKGKTHA